MDWQALFNAHQAGLEDFWGRRQNGPRFRRDFTLFGRPIRVSSNHQKVLAAVDDSAPLFSTAPASGAAPFTVHLVVGEMPIDPGPPPEDLFTVIQYSGHAEWLAMQIGEWGHCQIDTVAGRATAVLSPRLAERPYLVSRGLMNTIFTNLVIGAGFGMLHCTGLLRGKHTLLLMAPHNSGKSTTAFRLVLAGYTLLSDSQVYVSPDSERLQLLGFPVGRLKLRQDMVPHFPQVHALLKPEPVRDEIKQIFDLRKWNEERACTSAVYPQSVDLCLLTRHDAAHTILRPASPAAVWEAVMANSIFYDTAVAWQRNLAQINRLIARTRHHHLTIGTDPAHIIKTLDTLIP